VSDPRLPSGQKTMFTKFAKLAGKPDTAKNTLWQNCRKVEIIIQQSNETIHP